MNPFNKNLTKYARDLRKKSTYGERKLWKHIRGKQMLGYKFRRQVTLLNYIVDFYCIELRLAIEIDGGSHDELRVQKDLDRQSELESIGVRFLRFSKADVLGNLDDVLSTIEVWINQNQG